MKETVTVGGFEYIVDKLYYDADGERYCRVSDEQRSKQGKVYVYWNETNWFTDCLESIDQSDLGTIKKAPLELEDGEWYMCESEDGVKQVGYYDGALITEGVTIKGNSCLNPIRKNTHKPLYKMVKAND